MSMRVSAFSISILVILAIVLGTAATTSRAAQPPSTAVGIRSAAGNGGESPHPILTVAFEQVSDTSGKPPASSGSMTDVLLPQSLLAGACNPGSTVSDPVNDVVLAAIDVQAFGASVTSGNLVATFHLRDVPTEMTFNRPGSCNPEYQWGAYVDVDNNPATGQTPGNSARYNGAEYVLLASRPFSGCAAGSPIVGPIQNHMDLYVLRAAGGNSWNYTNIPASIEVDPSGDTFRLVGNIPGINSSSKVFFVTHDWNPAVGRQWDESACGPNSGATPTVVASPTASPTPTPTSTPTPVPIDAAELASQSEYLTVAPGAPISPWIEVRNTGTTTWTPAQYGYNGRGALQGDTGYITRNVAPGGTYRFFWNRTAPTTPGVYDYGFMLRHGTQEFGPYFFVRVTVVPARWTLMYYLAGDNDLGSQMWSTFQRLRSQVIQAQNPYVKVVVLFDGPDANDSAYYVIRRTGTTLIPKAELNTGDPQTLADFVAWAKASHTAEHFALIIAGHGSGISGVAPDVSAGNIITGSDFLFLRELRESMPTKVDVIYMRACLMGMIEPAYELRDKMDFYVASQTYMVTRGLVPPLDLGLEIPSISSSTTPSQLATMYFDAYQQQYLTYNPGAISVLDMSKFTLLVSKVNALAQALIANMATEKPILLSLQDVSRLQHFDRDGNYSINSSDDYVDLYDFASRLRQATGQSSVAAAALDLENATQQIVGGNSYARSGAWLPNTPQNDHSRAHGISIFWPSQRRSFLNMNWSSWADGVSSWLPRSADGLVENGPMDEATNAWMQSLIDFTNQTNPTDNPNPPSPIAVNIDYPFSMYLPSVSR